MRLLHLVVEDVEDVKETLVVMLAMVCLERLVPMVWRGRGEVPMVWLGLGGVPMVWLEMLVEDLDTARLWMVLSWWKTCLNCLH